MKSLPIKNIKTKFTLSALGFGYFIFFSGLDISPLFRGYITLIPIQLLVAIYFLYRHFKGTL